MSRVDRMFNGPMKKASDNFHNSARAKTCDPERSAHISSHNSVRVMPTGKEARIFAAIRAREEEKMEKEYKKAAKRAARKGRELPPRDEYYSHWGYNYYSKAR